MHVKPVQTGSEQNLSDRRSWTPKLCSCGAYLDSMNLTDAVQLTHYSGSFSERFIEGYRAYFRFARQP